MMFTKIKQAWRVLGGKVYIPSPSKTIYVKSGKANNQFVQLLNFRDSIIALDAQGKLWELRDDYELGGFVVKFLQESPRSY
jgi:alpha-tubulin suppressor-like RCC1 family protein